MTAPVLEVADLTKTFRAYRREWHRVASWFGASPKPSEELTVLEGVSFGIMPGQALGLVGQNGAGKSTLLKLITGTLAPTSGRITRNGRISAILELGLGFNPELTGRQNVYHSAGLMGYTRDQIAALMPEIEAFAEVGEYFDHPMRTYSSGMQMRVAFSVATAVRPDILIVDEALSVGDAYFQHKCSQRIRKYRENGTSLLLVSHDKTAVQSLCDRAILLDQGRMLRDGEPEEVVDFYNAMLADPENATVRVNHLDDGGVQTVSGTGEAFVEHIVIYNEQHIPVDVLSVGERAALAVTVRVNKDIPRLVLGYAIKDRLGQTMYGTNTHHTQQILEDVKAGHIVKYRIEFTAALGPGSYSIATALVSSDTHLTENYEWRDLALIFSVANTDQPEFIGSMWLPPRIEVGQG